MEYLSKTLKDTLEKLFNKKIELIIKDNRSVFIRSKNISTDQIKLHLHKAFLTAPFDILLSLKGYLIKNNKMELKKIKIFMENYFSKNNFKPFIERKKIDVQGDIYNLKEMLNHLNIAYFNDSIKVNITWFKKPVYNKLSSITFGSYDSYLKLIRINKLLDDIVFPSDFVSFVIYHEMLHYIHPVVIDENGRRKVHTKEFKKDEVKHEYFTEAKLFEKRFLKSGEIYGRT
jgi:predicted SprT family Zn-dependent metalloprotease